jgi:DnaK suppressor protein
VTALSELPRPDGGSAQETLPPPPTAAVRDHLLAMLGERSEEFGHSAKTFARLTNDSSQDPIGLDRASAALGMYCAIEAIEELHDALVRVEEGSFGACQTCSLPIPPERLEVLTQTRSCAACSTAADTRARARPGPFLGDPAGVLPRSSCRLTLQAPDPRVLVESMDRHPSSIRYPRTPRDPAPGQQSTGFEET